MRAVAWSVTIGAWLGAMGLLGHMPDPADPVRQSYLSVPPAPLARVVAGFENVAADALYIRFAIYWGFQLTHGRRFQNLYPLLELITDLDPKFRPAYEIGSLALGDSGQPNDAVALLDKGAKSAPGDYWFPYQAGMALFFFSDDYLRAAHYFERAARMPKAPPEAGYLAARMYERGTRRDLAVRAWWRIYNEATAPSVKQVARNSLLKLGEIANAPPERE